LEATSTRAKHNGKRSVLKRSVLCLRLGIGVYQEKAKTLHIDQVDLQSFHEGLSQYDEDGFMAELQALPDQDELEESKVPGTW
jgi:hypothetical protein